ncbi:MAG: TrkA C-terminal domain-containing protein [FCB group bacterium]|nr:TrkA C-terminal domain-containing protein [FCB group bacterium]
MARTTDIHRIEEKLINAGADSVVSPNFIGGMRIVSEMVRPHSVAFLDQLLRQKNTDLSLEELRLTESCLLCGTPISESKIYRKTGLRVIALRKKTSLMYIYNPTGKTILEAGDIIVVLGQNEQILALKKLTSE